MERAGASLTAKLASSLRKLGLAVGIAAAAIAPAASRTPLAGNEDVASTALPAEARQTQELIRAGGPFPYAKDGAVFANRERQLPRQARGYYREYTVKTPGARDRGAQRIVCGGQAVAPDACYYSADHYASFQRIVQ